MTEPTVFDEIFSRLTPDRIFKDSRATGAGVSVAVIDSGVERRCPRGQVPLAGTSILPIEGGVPSGRRAVALHRPPVEPARDHRRRTSS